MTRQDVHSSSSQEKFTLDDDPLFIRLSWVVGVTTLGDTVVQGRLRPVKERFDERRSLTRTLSLWDLGSIRTGHVLRRSEGLT